ncbi:hypothetical protein [Deinococcus sp.]|uniref:hypothetical protein n=1 Tax=Deinococcus sp. TaxID=47478 RepID=UPI0025B998F6|nr:hypothetical protein [Deinococcus sp.]
MDGLTIQHLLPYLLLLLRVLTALCFIHALVTRQELYWLFILGMATFFGGIFSTVGAVVYAVTVFFPWLGGARRQAGQAVSRGVNALKSLDVRIREASAALAESDTLQHRTDLAALQSRAGKLEEAQATLDPLLRGIYADDPLVLLSSAELDLARGKAGEAEQKLNLVDLKTSAGTRTRTLTLLAQAQEKQNLPADQTYQEALLGATTEEPRARYAAYLLAQGRRDEAQALLDAMKRTEQKATSLYRRQEGEWFTLAAQLRKELRS